MHGTFAEPLTRSTSQELIPLFGGCKLPVNNEILIPGAMYLTDDPFYSGGETHGPPWRQKIDGVVWRGVASGGRNKKENWSHFQRHRLIEMLNGTTVSGMEENSSRAMTFEMPPLEKYDVEYVATSAESNDSSCACCDINTSAAPGAGTRIGHPVSAAH